MDGDDYRGYADEMKPRVYIETTIISYLVGRLNRRDLYVAANQEFTRQWWAEQKDAFHLYASVIVRDEAADGDGTLASARLAYLDETTLLQVDADSEHLQAAILRDTGIPRKAELDALHIAIAAVNGMDYLLTWNCRHIANAFILPRVYSVCRSAGFEPPLICTPPELMEG